MCKANCECCDSGCCCGGECHRRAVSVLYRVDMEDGTGTAFCAECYEDAIASDLYRDEQDEQDDDEQDSSVPVLEVQHGWANMATWMMAYRLGMQHGETVLALATECYTEADGAGAAESDLMGQLERRFGSGGEVDWREIAANVLAQLCPDISRWQD